MPEHLDFSSVKLIADFEPPDSKGITERWFKWAMLTCYSSHKDNNIGNTRKCKRARGWMASVL